MNAIDTAPRNTPVIIWNADHPEYGHHLMERRGGRWVGMAFTVMGPARVTWDEENFGSPTHWREATQP